MSTWTEPMDRRRRPGVTRADVRAELDSRAAVVMDSREQQRQMTIYRQRADDAERRLVRCLAEPPISTSDTDGRWTALAFVMCLLLCTLFYAALWVWLLGPLPVTPFDWSQLGEYREWRP